ncbi:hypothetical protein F2Q68_00046242 [Brassica cretica]|uniref:Bet v I/Major latex protein domain-containing protein n=1 Tax=Brassica cretica TaxID=69181 RepID=A0A8S9LKZ6_BRACR|nr:hypothetical protein F2Q68_00046242 [Brassica cretica]
MAEAANLVGKLEADVEIKSSAEKFYHMWAGRVHDLPKATPDKIQNCELQEGDWGKVGSVVIWSYVIGKSLVEEVEREKNLITFRVIKSDLLKMYKSFVSTIQVTPKHGGPGGIVHWDLEYEKVSEEVGHPESHLQDKFYKLVVISRSLKKLKGSWILQLLMSVVRFLVAAIPFTPFVVRSLSDAETRNSGIELGSLGYLMQALGLLTTDAGRASFISIFTIIVEFSGSSPCVGQNISHELKLRKISYLYSAMSVCTQTCVIAPLRCREEIDCTSVSDKGRRFSTSPIVVRSRKDASTLLEK